jgi:DNA-binding response OmpR family regulator
METMSRRQASELGAAQLLSKPVDFDLLKAQLQPAVRRHGSGTTPPGRMTA